MSVRLSLINAVLATLIPVLLPTNSVAHLPQIAPQVSTQEQPMQPQNRNPKYLLIHGRVGAAYHDNGRLGPSAGGSLSILSNERLLSLRLQVFLEDCIMFCDDPIEKTWDLGLLYSKPRRGRWGFLSIGAGISLVGDMKRGKFIRDGTTWSTDVYEEVVIYTVGLPYEARAIWTPAKSGVFGIGFCATGDFNSLESSHGLNVELHLMGKMGKALPKDPR